MESRCTAADVSHIKRPEDWPFPIPTLTAECIDELIDALARDAGNAGDYYDELDGGTREMRNPDDETEIRNYYLHNEWTHDQQRHI